MGDDTRPLDRNLALELMRVTEAGALAAAGAVHKHAPDLANRLAVAAFRHTLASLPIDGVVMVGEGQERSSERLFLGERFGDAEEPRMDIAVDPVDGAELVAAGLPGAICAVALAPRNTLFRTHVSYMERIVVSSAAAGVIDLDSGVSANLTAVAAALGKSVDELVVVMLERRRNEVLLDDVKSAGAQVKLIPDGDVAAAILAALPEDNGFDVLLGIGGAPEASLTACAVHCLGGGMQARLWAGDDEQRAQIEREGRSTTAVLRTSDLCGGGPHVYMSLSGITDGELLHGVRYRGAYATTQSLVMRSYTGTARRVESTHDLARLVPVVGSAYELGRGV